MPDYQFEWDFDKDLSNQEKHGISFTEAAKAFEDPNRMILRDKRQGGRKEKRYFCIGQVRRGIVTVRFTYRDNAIRIYGAGFWRKETALYESKRRTYR